MKRIFKTLAILLVFASISQARFIDWSRNTFNYTMPKVDGTKTLLMNGEGDIRFGHGVVNTTQIFLDVATADIDVISTWTAAYISTATLLASGTTWVLADSYITDGCITSRNIVIKAFVHLYNDTGVALTSAAVTGIVVATGIDAQGYEVTETFALSTNTATGNVAFASIASFAITASAITNQNGASVGISMGTGVKIGLANNVIVASDVYNVNEAGSKVTSGSYTLNVTYDTITFSSSPTGSNDYTVTYINKGRNY